MEGRAAQRGQRKRLERGGRGPGNSFLKEEGPHTCRIDTRPPLSWGTGRAPVSQPLPSTSPDLSDQPRAKPPTCRGPRVSRRTGFGQGAPLRPAEGRTAEGRWGSGWAQPSAASRPPPVASAGARPRFSPPAAAAAAPRPPGPRRLGGCWSGRWSRARGRRAGGKVRGAGAAGAGRAAPGAPRGEWGPLPGPPGVARPRGVGAASWRSPAGDLGEARAAGRVVQRPASRRPVAGAAGEGAGKGLGALGLGAARPREGAAPSGGRAGTREEAAREGPGCCRAGCHLASPTFLVAFSCLMTFSYTH